MKDKLIAKAMKDAKFRAALLKDPVSAIEKELGVKAPKGVKIKVVEDAADTVHLVLPPARSGALSENELDTVAGGASITGCLPTQNNCQLNSNAPCNG